MAATTGSRAAALALVATGLLAACGGDDEPEGDGPDRAQSASETAGGPTGDDCATEVVVTLPDQSEVTLDDAGALDIGAGTAYTIYAADFEVVDPSSVSGAMPEEGGHLATLAITTFNAEGAPKKVKEGATIEWTDKFGVLTFAVVLNEGTTALGDSLGGSGSVEVVALDEESLCLDLDYSDDQKSLRGTIGADIS